ncbi:efflux RND transporter periplasmic adaptor subunit [Acidithiobacillus caldus]|uniref:efflux RND transporter periplasmic adaptor subunit n=1 Tax=Acidithiobacillus caldus TaxID=33059 RepID=UPI001C075C1A|nr:efflux RND transporter periplasmic adaptor subunit [Acidithiobacillus caldus]MBU2801943.1 efflux RND transporter periplasmic adaptor subunit [Acidithiobacillus caldus]
MTQPRHRYLQRFATALVLAPWLALSLPNTAAAEVSAKVQLQDVAVHELHEDLRAYGTVEFDPQGAQTLSLQAEALIQQVLVAPGQEVRKGEGLLRLNPSSNDRQMLEQARINLRFAEEDLHRTESLLSRQLATNAQLATARQNRDKAAADYHALATRLAPLQGGVLRAPGNGVITQVFAKAGDLVPAGQALIQLQKGRQMRVVLGIEAEDLARVHVGDDVRVQSLERGSAVIAGKIRQIYAQVDPRTHLAQAVVSLPADSPFLPGSMVSAQIRLRSLRMPAVPDSAVLTDKGRPYAFIAVHGRAERRWLELGPRDGHWQGIRRGLRVGEAVVTLGNYELHEHMLLRTDGQP